MGESVTEPQVNPVIHLVMTTFSIVNSTQMNVVMNGEHSHSNSVNEGSPSIAQHQAQGECS